MESAKLPKMIKSHRNGKGNEWGREVRTVSYHRTTAIYNRLNEC